MEDTYKSEVSLALWDVISAYRKEHGETLSRFAKESRVSVSSLQRLERGKGNPSLFMVCRMAVHMGITLGDLSDACQRSMEAKRRDQDQP